MLSNSLKCKNDAECIHLKVSKTSKGKIFAFIETFSV